MYFQQTTHAVKLLKQHFSQQDIDKIRKTHKLMREGHDHPISVGSLQDQHMILRVLSQQQILATLEEVLSNRQAKIYKK